ncbi:protein of unknown function [Bacteroides luti]|jgi:hypothetical protein|uniref:DUF4172 domain-containing protein n=1 Tax=Bacteroides luti TaxID=1297750 RepID=A0A1M5FWW7_9BACE|nr:DUF4172 domain-containing protein [Bacteroides luti]SHF95884.1 protein of unknown function [Bacteroides luti]
MRKVYIWQQDEWPHFIWNDAALSYKLGRVRALQGKLVGYELVGG